MIIVVYVIYNSFDTDSYFWRTKYLSVVSFVNNKIRNILITFLEVFRLNSCLLLGSSTPYISIFYYSVDNSMWGNECLARGRSIMVISWTLSTDTWAQRAFGWPDSLFLKQPHSDWPRLCREPGSELGGMGGNLRYITSPSFSRFLVICIKLFWT